ncbi:MAG TPA: peptide deformylase [Gemmatimonadales bacterium]|nr:peptide deformylase [Gemmatimonadales bacterium]
MALRDLHLLGSPVLRTRSKNIEAIDDEVRGFIADLFETMDAAKGIGLAANQVGIARRVAVVDVEGQRFAMINPVIRSAEGRSRAEEGCLSIPELYGDVTRPDRIVLEATDEQGKPFTLEASGLVARCIQHEIDHLDGILFVDHLSPLKRQLLLARYKKDHRGEDVIKPLKPATNGR